MDTFLVLFLYGCFLFSKTQGEGQVCFQCRSYDGDSPNAQCPINEELSFNPEMFETCYGPCFTMENASDVKSGVRGCITSLTGLPSLLPSSDGCYSWQGRTICLCYKGFCNRMPIGISSGVELEDHSVSSTTTTTTTTTAATHGEGQVCFQCRSYDGDSPNAQCPINEELSFNPEMFETCYGPCFTMENASDAKSGVRGCIISLTGLPSLLPSSDGCYSWQGRTICLCYKDFCNRRPIGKSSGISLEDQSAGPSSTTAGPTTTTIKITNPGIPGFSTTCLECSNYVGDTYNSACAMNETLTAVMVQSSKCAAPCYTMSVAGDPKLVVRGCGTDVVSFPSPLPPDGCYDWQERTVCICYSPMCNKAPLRNSNGVSLNAHLSSLETPELPTVTTAKPTTKNPVLNCFECISYFNGKYNDLCPKNSSVDVGKTYQGKCKGPCFTRGDANNGELVVRGCTVSQGTLPQPLPEDGCYDWNGAPFCVCHKTLCNMYALGKSSGVSLDAHLANIEQPVDENGPLQCYQCSNYGPSGEFIPQCPKDGRVNSQTVYSGNCTGACFTRTFKDNSTKVGRGCTDTQYGLPEPLPKDGCYNWNDETWCVCKTHRCNGAPIGKSSGKDLDAHLSELVDVIEESDGINKCYQCINYDSKGNYYPQCAKNSRVRNAFLGPCNGTCYIRSYDYDDRLVARGCSTSQWSLPNPLPPDGCYNWYSEVWCVCSRSRCNGEPLGTSKNVEFDAHLPKDGNGAIRFGYERPQQFQMLLSLVFILCLWYKFPNIV